MNRRDIIRLALFSVLALAGAASARAEDDEKKDDKSDSEKDSNDESSSSSDSSDSEDNNTDRTGTSGTQADGDSDDGSEDDDGDNDDDQYKARQAVQSAEALPLTDMIAIFRREVGGQIIDVRLVSIWFQLRYKFTFVDTTGAVRRSYFDAKTGTLLK